jgi:hypothetical protein
VLEVMNFVTPVEMLIVFVCSAERRTVTLCSCQQMKMKRRNCRCVNSSLHLFLVYQFLWLFCQQNYHIYLNARQQDSSNLRRPPKYNMSAKGKFIYSKLRWPPTNTMSAMKKYFIINLLHLIHTAHQLLSTCTAQCHYLHHHSWCLHLPHARS